MFRVFYTQPEIKMSRTCSSTPDFIKQALRKAKPTIKSCLLFPCIMLGFINVLSADLVKKKKTRKIESVTPIAYLEYPGLCRF